MLRLFDTVSPVNTPLMFGFWSSAQLMLCLFSTCFLHTLPRNTGLLQPVAAP